MSVSLLEYDSIMAKYKASFRSELSCKTYTYHLLKFCDNPVSLLDLTQKEAEDRLIDFIIRRRNMGNPCGYIKNFVKAVCRLYLVNDIVLNVAKIHRFMPEDVRVKKDRAYTVEEIRKILSIGDERTRVIVLLLASTGIRLGAIPLLKYSDLESKGDIYRIIVYSNSKGEYYTYCTPECKETLDFYFEARQRVGEEFTARTPIIREQYNRRSLLNIRHPKAVTRGLVAKLLTSLMETAGLRTTIHSKQDNKHDVMLVHGFRKFFNTQLVTARTNPLVKELLMGHKVGLEQNYYRPLEEDVQAEYEKAIDALTINPENRLKRKVEKLEVEKTEYERLAAEIEAIKKKIK